MGIKRSASRILLTFGSLILALAACSPGSRTPSGTPTPDELGRILEQYNLNRSELADLAGGSRIIFLGDSITVAGVKEGGYVSMVEEALEILYPDREIEVRAAGVVSDTVSHLRRRLSRDVLAHRPTHVVIYVGVNDVAGLGPAEAALDAGKQAYRTGLTDLVDRIQATGAEVILCTPGVLGEVVDDDSRYNRALDDYAEVVHELAEDRESGVCDLRAEFSEYLREHNSSERTRGLLTLDGIHLSERGNRLVAGSILRALTNERSSTPGS